MGGEIRTVIERTFPNGGTLPFMARPREFDETTVLNAARDTFWANGVAGTSISDLSESTGLSVGSIYKAFGSKSGLCLSSLDAYLSAGLEHAKQQLGGADTALQGIEAWLDAMASQAAETSPTRGCFAVNCATELAEGDEAVRIRLRQHDANLRQSIRQALAAAVAVGELTGDPATGAMLLCTTVNGLQVESRKGISLDDARATVSLALDAIR